MEEKMKNITLLGSLLSFGINSPCYSVNKIEKPVAVKLYQEKIEDKDEVTEIGTGWYDARLITPGTQVYLKDESTYKLHKQTSDPVALHLYKKNPGQTDSKSQSHSLLKSSSESVAVSVDTSRRTQTKRGDEKKKTDVQYDKSHISQKGKDFKVDANKVSSKNKPEDKANYDGGHLVDHKFSAQGSHTDGFNYVPQHHFYSRWLKESIVKSAHGYLEIPLFTSNPPMIKVLGEDRYDAIPIGILLAPLMNLQIQDMYYFPNNQYNYRQLQLDLGLKCSRVAEIFKLKPAFHQLLWPAIIHDVRARDANLARQLAQEAKGGNVVNALIDGMSIIDLDDEEEVISSLASDVIHQADVDVSNVLCIGKSNLKALNKGQANPTALNQAFNALGQFLVDYAMKNALKSEMLTTHSRIMFANIITDFIECYHQVSDKALKCVDNAYKDVYKATLKELWKIKNKMNSRDIIYFANLYQKLSSPFIHHALFNGYKMVEHMDFEENVIKFITILQEIHDNPRKKNPDQSEMQNLVDLFLDAQEHLSYIVCNGYPFSELRVQSHFLKSAKAKVKQWDSLSSASSGSFQTSPNSATSFRKVDDLNKALISYLGTNSSLTYQNDDDSQEEEDDTEEDSN
jgi:hypothetical protein